MKKVKVLGLACVLLSGCATGETVLAARYSDGVLTATTAKEKYSIKLDDEQQKAYRSAVDAFYNGKAPIKTLKQTRSVVSENVHPAGLVYMTDSGMLFVYVGDKKIKLSEKFGRAIHEGKTDVTL